MLGARVALQRVCQWSTTEIMSEKGLLGGGSTGAGRHFSGVELCRSGTDQAASACRLSAGTCHLPRGEPGDRLYIILSGKVKVGRRSPDGRENLLTIMGPSDMFGELSIFDPGPRTSSATTVTEVRAVSMDRDALRAWIKDRPEIAEQLLRVLARRLRRTNNNLADLIFTDVPGRVAKQLLQLAQRFAPRRAARCASPTTSRRKRSPSSSGPRARPSTRRSPTSPSAAGCAWRARAC